MTLTSEIQYYLDIDNQPKLRELLNALLPVEQADLISDLPKDQHLKIFNLLKENDANSTFEWLPLDIQKELIYALPSERSARLLNAISPDDRVAFFEELPGPILNQLLKLLTNEERTLTLKLLGYPEDSVGRLMTPDYLAIKMSWTVEKVLDYVRKNGRDTETINILYVVDDEGHLIDDIKIRNFLLADPQKKVYDLADNKFIALSAKDDQELAINAFRKNNRVALPVIDSHGVLLGIVTFDDILNIAKEEDIEDMQKIGGMQALEAPYMRTPFLELMKKRAGWLVLLFLGEMLTTTAMAYFQDEIARAVILSLFIPLIVSSGGNSGSQAATLVISAMTVGEVNFKDWWRIMRREVASGLFLGIILGSIAFARISLWSTFSTVYGEHWILIAFTVFVSLIGVVLCGTIAGSMLPLLLKRVGADPTVSSTPFIATFIDVTGIIIYFWVALLILQGTLL